MTDDPDSDFDDPLYRMYCSVSGLMLQKPDRRIMAGHAELIEHGSRMLGTTMVAMDYESLQAMPAAIRLRRNGLRVRLPQEKLIEHIELWSVPGVCVDSRPDRLAEAATDCHVYGDRLGWWVNVLTGPVDPAAARDLVGKVEINAPD